MLQYYKNFIEMYKTSVGLEPYMWMENLQKKMSK